MRSIIFTTICPSTFSFSSWLVVDEFGMQQLSITGRLLTASIPDKAIVLSSSGLNGLKFNKVFSGFSLLHL